MFKIIKRMAVLSSLLVLSWSCVEEQHYTIYRYSSGLSSFAVRLVSYSSEASMNLLTSLASSKETMNVEGFTYTYYYYNNLTLKVAWVADNCWEVIGVGEPTNFSLQVVREPSDNLEDDYKWTITSFSLDYDESNGYTAVMTTEGDIVYDWHESNSTMSKRWNLLQTGTYYLQTFISNVEGDSCILRYEEGDYTDEVLMVSTGSGLPYRN